MNPADIFSFDLRPFIDGAMFGYIAFVVVVLFLDKNSET